MRKTVEAGSWVMRWLFFAACTGIVCEFIAASSFVWSTAAARGILVAGGIVLLIPGTFFIDLFGGVAQHAWDNYEWNIARKIIGVLFAGTLVVSISYGWFMVWVLRRLWPYSIRWGDWLSTAAGSGSAISSGLPTWFLVGVNVVLVVIVAKFFSRNPLYPFRHAFSTLGLRKVLLGTILMSYIRTLAPPRDVFLQAPVIGWMPILAIAVVLHVSTPITMLAISTPVLLLALCVPAWLQDLAPPLWLYLGSSSRDSFVTFYELRASWKLHGVNLLDRAGPAGQDFYDIWRRFYVKGALVPYDPGIGRIWSLRTRPQLWQTAVRLLATFTPVIVVDMRDASEIVQFEVAWLMRRQLLKQTIVIQIPNQSGLADEFQGSGAKVVDEKSLLASEWSGSSVIFRPLHPV